MSDSILNCFQAEYDVIRKVLPEAKITTNLMGFYKPLDYQKWAKKMDFISWDNYPSVDDAPAKIAMAHDLMRGIKQGKPFALMEQTPSVTNWQPYNALKRPGVMRLWSYQAVAHGADTVMFFQMRRSIGACEKYHGAVIDHVGNENTRVFREVAALGDELVKLGGRTLGSRTAAKIGMMFDWDNWWALEYSAGPSCELKYLTEFSRYYEALRNLNYDVDIISCEDDLSRYKVVIAPSLYMVKGNNDQKIRNFVKEGGTFLTTFFSGIVQENDLVTLGGYPGKLRDILGIWVEENDALQPGKENAFSYKETKYPAVLLCDILHLEGAQKADDKGYLEDFYKGFPVITRNQFGKGRAYYIATASDEAFYKKFLEDICNEADVAKIMEPVEEVEVATRENNKERFVFVLNHSDETREITLPWDCQDIITMKQYQKGKISILSKDVKIFSLKRSNEK